MFCFVSDKTTICGENEFDGGNNLLDHPYNCTMYISCKLDHTFSHEGYVSWYEDGKHVFYRAKQRTGWKFEVDCAVQERKSMYVHIYFLRVYVLTMKNLPPFSKLFYLTDVSTYIHSYIIK